MKLPTFSIGGGALGHSYDNENVVIVVHHHWWNLLREVLGVVVLFIVPFIAIPLAGVFIPTTGIDASKIGAAFGFFGSLWALTCWHILFTRWTDYYFDVWIVTNRRIVDMNLDGLFKVNIGSMLDLDHIQEISTHTEGIIQNILGIGTILIQTAATLHSEFNFTEVSNPAKIEDIIRKVQVEFHLAKGSEPSQGV